MPEVIPEVRSYRFGDDVGLKHDNFDFVVTADFDAADSYLAYRDHPDHQKVVADCWARSSPRGRRCSSSGRRRCHRSAG